MAADILARLPALLDSLHAHASTFCKTADGSMNCLGVFLGNEVCGICGVTELLCLAFVHM